MIDVRFQPVLQRRQHRGHHPVNQRVKWSTKTGRPSDYLPEVAADICSLLADGESLRKVGERPGMPNKATVFSWLPSIKSFATNTRKLLRHALTQFRRDVRYRRQHCRRGCAVGKARLSIETISAKLAPVFTTPNMRYRCSHYGRGSAKTRTFAMMTVIKACQAMMNRESGVILCARKSMN